MSLKKSLSFLVLLSMLLAMLAGCTAAAPAAQAPAAEATAAAAEGTTEATAEGAAPAADAKPIKIGVSMLFDDLWLTTMRDAMTDVRQEPRPDVELVMVDSKEDVATQLGQVENFVSQKAWTPSCSCRPTPMPPTR